MAALEDISLIEYDDAYARDAVAMWRASKEKALGVKDIHSFDDDLDFLRNRLVHGNKVYLAIHEPTGTVAGIMAIDGAELNQLYVHVDYQRIGIGTRFLALAKSLSPSKLKLYTFEINADAQAFYKKHGFMITGRGHQNEENLPDIRYEWTEPKPSAS
jgi:ribosomal protein S18 acetylase RimI-like enzyme